MGYDVSICHTKGSQFLKVNFYEVSGPEKSIFVACYTPMRTTKISTPQKLRPYGSMTLWSLWSGTKTTVYMKSVGSIKYGKLS